MAEPVVIVDNVRDLSRPVEVRAAEPGAPAERYLTVSFAGGRTQDHQPSRSPMGSTLGNAGYIQRLVVRQGRQRSGARVTR